MSPTNRIHNATAAYQYTEGAGPGVLRPYTDVKNMHASLKLIREIYKVRSCNYLINKSVIQKKSIKICFNYHIKKCEGTPKE